MHPLNTLHRLQSIRSELGEVYANQLLFTFAISLVGVFLPVYVVQLHFPFAAAIAFLAAIWSGIAFLSPVAASLASRIGLKHTILLSTPLQVAFLAFLVFFPPAELPLLLAIGFLGGLSDALYWTALNIEFVRNADRLNRVKEVGTLIALPRFAAILAPVLAGALLAAAGFPALFGIAALLLLGSALPLFLSQDFRPARASLRSRLSVVWRGHSPTLGAASAARFFLQGTVLMAEAVLWPLWLFFAFGDLVVVGLAATLSAAGIALFTLLASRAKRSLFRAGCALLLLSWLGRALPAFAPEGAWAFALAPALALSFLGGLALTLVNLSIYSDFAAAARRKAEPSAVFREVWLNAGRIVPALLVALLFAGPAAGFFVAAAASVLLLAFPPKR